MNYVEFISKQTMVPAGDAINMLSQILLSAHHMNLGDKPEKIRQDKCKYVRSQITRLYKAGKVDEGAIIYYDSSDQYSDASGYYSDGSCDFFEDDTPFRMDMKLSTVNIKQLTREIVLELEGTGNAVPADLMILIGDNNHQPVVVSKSDIAPDTVIISSVADKNTPIEPATKGNQYRFLKTDKGWNLQFEDVVLQGVKDWAGMGYIKILLQNPDQKIGVIKLQELAGTANPVPNDNPEGEDVPDPGVTMEHQEYDNFPEKSASVGGINLWESSDQRAIQEYKEQIEIIENKLKEARACKVQNKSKIERLEKDKAAFESQLTEASYKAKDPIVDKARRSVLKVITDTVKNIRKLEELCNYNDRPISSHLTRSIKTGASCSYVTSGDNPPSWQF